MVPVVNPVTTTTPLGWAVLGLAGLLTYKFGKKSGLKNGDDIDKPCLGDRAVKGTMKTFYKVKKSVGNTLSNTGTKYSTMWNEAQEEVKSST